MPIRLCLAPGCGGAATYRGRYVFRDPNEDDRVWVLYDWDEEGLQNFLSDPEVPSIVQEAGYKGRLQPAELARPCSRGRSSGGSSSKQPALSMAARRSGSRLSADARRARPKPGPPTRRGASVPC